jgi:transcription termination factor Rho
VPAEAGTGSADRPAGETGPAAADQPAEAGRTRRRAAGLSGMVLSELQELASGLGIAGTARMRKNDLIAAIRDQQSGSGQGTLDGTAADANGAAGQTSARTRSRSASRPAGPPAAEQPALPDVSAVAAPVRTEQPAVADWPPAERQTGTPAAEAPAAVLDAPVPVADAPAPVAETPPAPNQDAEPTAAPSSGDQPQAVAADAGTRTGSRRDIGQRRDGGQREGGQREGGQREGGQRDGGQREGGQREGGQRDGGQRGQQRDGGNQQRGGQQRDGGQRDGGPRDGGPRDDDDDGDGNRRRGRRFRDRRGRGSGASGSGGPRERFAGEAEPVIAEDDILVPVAGILDILDNYAFVRTSGYLPGQNDVYVSLSQVRKNGLRRGDAITGAVRQPREGERRDKFNALVRLDSVNGTDTEQARNRPDFLKLVPLYPQDRLRLETEPHILTTRVIDLVMPLGKGQRALIVSPPKAGKTMVLQAIANAITRNNPECHLMVVLIDERPEEVTDMQRSVKGEVIASTFDRPPSDHTTVAELSIERAKRLVELGHDVVVLLDSITRLGRAYNNASPASGRILSGGIDSTALYPPKRFLGAARNIENGGSLTILATALVETGSTGDTVIFEEFKGTGNAELRLDRKIADRRVFPAIDIPQSGTRKEEILMAPEELAIVIKLRRVLHALDAQQSIDLLLDKLKETRTNVEFLMQVQKTTVSPD